MGSTCCSLYVFPEKPIFLVKPYYIITVNNQYKFFNKFKKKLINEIEKSNEKINLIIDMNKYRLKLEYKNNKYHINFYTSLIHNTFIEVQRRTNPTNDIIVIQKVIENTFNSIPQLQGLFHYMRLFF
jgi:hypothetical protein